MNKYAQRFVEFSDGFCVLWHPDIDLLKLNQGRGPVSDVKIRDVWNSAEAFNDYLAESRAVAFANSL